MNISYKNNLHGNSAFHVEAKQGKRRQGHCSAPWDIQDILKTSSTQVQPPVAIQGGS